MAQTESGAPPPEDSPGIGGDPTEHGASEPEEEPIAFLDRLIAFFIVIGPWSLLIVEVQELLGNRISDWTHNMILLAAIVIFLLVVGYLSKWVFRFRKKWHG
ncbi:MAG: hypothetical protein HY913_05620 [Desulfomonile tiedjei]|nr:hypothetical protein [Desulfomonile tiedjei]